ncbi:hypothetical protein D9757_011249 [Collybiopsis confluens]|uniref:DUF6534 domain-containing protein n=1 Tax=Collybiopsis confluens TaxID=2823264 RepID=A0A8H5LSG4_9AGAR|nr:hypothetical protein D9757_011249 [Collybiopsis confluens]
MIDTDWGMTRVSLQIPPPSYTVQFSHFLLLPVNLNLIRSLFFSLLLLAMEALDNTFGATLIGVIVAGVLLGVSLSQTYYYFSQQSDTPAIRSLVAAIVFFEVVHQIMISHSVYYYLVTNYNKPYALVAVIWSLLTEVFFNGFTAFSVQSFLTWRIWKLSQNNLLTAVIMFLVLAEFGKMCRCLVRVKTFADLAADLKGLSITVNALAAAGDVLIAGTLTFLMQTSKTGFSRSDTMLNKLTLFAVTTGALTSLCAVASLVSILAAPNTFIYVSFFFCMGRLYTNSLLATLNARKMIRSAGDNVHPTSGPNISFWSGSFAGSFPKPAVSFPSNSKLTQPTELDIKINPVHGIRTQDHQGT